MRGLHGLAWRGLRARPLRTALTTVGVTLGVAVLYAGLATTSGIDVAVDRAVVAQLGRAELRVSAVAEGGLSEATLAAIRATPGVVAAAPSFERRTFLAASLARPGPLPEPVTLLGIDPTLEPTIQDLTLEAGAPLAADDDPIALVSAALARDDGLAIGSRLELQGLDARLALRVGGILSDQGVWPGVGGRIVVTDIDLARSAFGAGGSTRVDLDLVDGSEPAAVVEALEASLLREPYIVSAPSDVAAALHASTGDFAATTALIAAIALFTGAFLIFNSLSMTVVERVHELGLLRAGGATRGQLTRYILVQAAVMGVVGAVTGIVAGAALAAGIATWMGSVGALPLGDPTTAVGDAVLAASIGVAVTLAAAIEPARRAGSVTPVEAMRTRLDGSRARRARLRWLVVVFGAVAGVGLVIWPRAAGETALVRSLLVYGILLVVALAVPFALPQLARLAGRPFALVSRMEERLARASVVRDRARAALTVGALTVGLAMVVALGGVGQHARAASGASIDDVVPGELVLTSVFPRPSHERIDETLDALTGVASVSPLATFDMAVDGRRADGVAMVGADLALAGRLDLLAGERSSALAALDRGGAVIVPAGIAARDGLVVGSTISVAGADGARLDLDVVGVAERTLPGRSGESILVGWREADRLGVAGADAFAIRFEADASAVDRAAVHDEARRLALDPVPLERIQGAIGEALDRVFGLFDILSLVAVIVASLGIVNTLTINVFERVREIGILRAAGMSRRQVWRSVVVEAGITGLVGAMCGVVTGLVVGAVLVVMSGGRWQLAAGVPWGAIAVALVLGVALAMIAAAYPARLASRISIVRAVRYE